LYVRGVLPAAGYLTGGPAWWEVGRFLGPSIRDFHGRVSLPDVWAGAGIADVRARRLSLGGGLVVWGVRA
jgi:hypothetical protein